MFTIKDDAITNSSEFNCQNCRSLIKLNKKMFKEFYDKIGENAEINHIPDEAKITVKFDI